MSALDTYHVIAKYYDGAYAAKQDLVDLPFYLDLAAQSRGPVLEDRLRHRPRPPAHRPQRHRNLRSRQLAAHARRPEQNLAREPQEVRQRITVHEGDMRSFRLNRKFPLVMIPFRPMQHMFTVEDQVAALKTAAAHLTDTGILGLRCLLSQVRHDLDEESEKKSPRWSGPHLPIPPSSCAASSAKMRSTRSIRSSALPSFSAPTSPATSSSKKRKPSASATTPTRICAHCSDSQASSQSPNTAPSPRLRLDNTAEQMIFLLRKSS